MTEGEPQARARARFTNMDMTFLMRGPQSTVSGRLYPRSSVCGLRSESARARE